MAAKRPYSAFPSDDRAFGAVVQSVMDVAEDLDAVRHLLRITHPNAEVVRQSEFACIGLEPLRLYIYRDGQPVPLTSAT